MKPSNKFEDPRWERKKLHVIRLRGNACEVCGNTRHLRVHHLLYAKSVNPWEYPDDQYQCICEPCVHERKPLVEAAVDNLRLMLAKLPTPSLRDAVAESGVEK